MRNIILITGLIIGVILRNVGKKTQIYKYTKIVGLIIIAVCLVVVLQDFAKDFIDGFTDGISAK